MTRETARFIAGMLLGKEMNAGKLRESLQAGLQAIEGRADDSSVKLLEVIVSIGWRTGAEESAYELLAAADELRGEL